MLVCCTEIDVKIIKDVGKLFISHETYLSTSIDEMSTCRLEMVLKTGGPHDDSLSTPFASPAKTSVPQQSISPAAKNTSTNFQQKSGSKTVVDCCIIWDLDTCFIDTIDEVHSIFGSVDKKIYDLFGAKVSPTSTKYLFYTQQENASVLKV